MEHLVKKFSMYDVVERVVKTFEVDVDQTGPTTLDRYKAIANTLKKLGCYGKDTNPFKLRSSTTDSGGAMTKEGLADLLVENNYALLVLLVVTYGIHNTQLQLSVPTVQLLGPGELGKRNVMQLLHCVYALQKSLPIDEWWKVVDMGVKDAKKYVEEGPPEATMAKKRDDYIEFLQERKEKMGSNYTRLPLNKWIDSHHFDQKINVIFSYKEWEPTNVQVKELANIRGCGMTLMKKEQWLVNYQTQ
jgi:hypothetical protein